MPHHAYSRPDGFADRAPAICRAARRLESQLVDYFSALSFDEVAVPSLEYADLYTSGFVGRQRVGDLFAVPLDQGRGFPAPGDGSGRIDPEQISYEAVLRPDLTTPMARMYLLSRLSSGELHEGDPLSGGTPRPARWLSAGSVFRRVSPDRANEQRQLNLEWFCPPPFFDAPDRPRPAALMARWALAALARLRSEGPRLAEIRVGHRGLLRDLVARHAAASLAPADLDRLLSGLERLRQARHRALRASSPALLSLWHDHPQWHRRAAAAQIDPANPDPEAIRAALPSLELEAIRPTWLRLGVDPARLAPLIALDSPDDLLALAADLPDADDPRSHAGDARACIAQIRADLSADPADPTPPPALLLSADPSRGFAYYDGLTFEIYGVPLPGARKRRWVGGGRYRLDGLAARVSAASGLPLPDPAASFHGVGMAFDLDHLAEALALAAYLTPSAESRP